MDLLRNQERIMDKLRVHKDYYPSPPSTSKEEDQGDGREERQAPPRMNENWEPTNQLIRQVFNLLSLILHRG